MIRQAKQSQTDFYREFLMGRHAFNPQDFGINLDREEFLDKMVDEFNTTFKGQLTVDELILHPRDALSFCDDIRRKHGWYDLPDDIILRSIMQMRKNPGG
jgi:hypothetical protein